MPLHVTDEQMTMIYRASDVLLPPDRAAFMAQTGCARSRSLATETSAVRSGNCSGNISDHR
jgi:hypothetical protein